VNRDSVGAELESELDNSLNYRTTFTPPMTDPGGTYELFTTFSGDWSGHHVHSSVSKQLEPACKLALAAAFHDPTARRRGNEEEKTEPISERVQQPEDQTGDRDSRCDDTAANHKELPEDTHVFERQRVRHDRAELLRVNLACSRCDGVHGHHRR